MQTFGYWDLALIIAVAVMSTAMSYVHSPKLKALILSFPIPFSLASMALGSHVGVSHVMGMSLLLLYTFGVRWLHVQLRLPIIPSILIAVLGYIFIGGTLAKVVPNSPVVFWSTAALTFLLGIGLWLRVPHRIEPGHRSRLPVALKSLIVVCIVVAIIVIKDYLKGFMTFCPMVSILAAYEARHSLWTMGRQMPVIMIVMAPMMAVIYSTQNDLGLGPALLCGWAIFPLLLAPLTVHMWKQQERREAETGSGAC